jgi:hypothetical protein
MTTALVNPVSAVVCTGAAAYALARCKPWAKPEVASVEASKPFVLVRDAATQCDEGELQSEAETEAEQAADGQQEGQDADPLAAGTALREVATSRPDAEDAGTQCGEKDLLLNKEGDADTAVRQRQVATARPSVQDAATQCAQLSKDD